jgi:hypothetical protein
MHRSGTETPVAVLLGGFLLGAALFFAMDAKSDAVPRDQSAAAKVYYSDTIKDIILADCGRCHSGAVRNLMDYDSLKAYADSGVLGGMLQGPMAGFAGSDAQVILSWIDGGALEQPALSPVAFNRGQGGPGPGGPGGGPVIVKPAGRVTYENSIKFIFAKDCLRCHAGPFRNLTTYDNIKAYVDSGLLKTLVQRGGPMNRFAGRDSRKIIRWVDDGAPLDSASL